VRFVLFAVSTPFASELAETARRAGHEYVAVRNWPGAPVPDEIAVVLEADGLGPELLALPFTVPQTVPAHRAAAIADARRRGLGFLLTLIDPTATVASTASLEEGCYVGTGSVIASGAQLGAGSLINRSASIGHHVELEAYVCTGPAVTLSGLCRVKRGAFLGAGAILAPEVTIGAGAIVGAGAVVIRDVGPGDVVAGNPARVIRRVDPDPGYPPG
jgi:sugar O-acyltransferase (sialic acid O-acetyltransferase NeuD family)